MTLGWQTWHHMLGSLSHSKHLKRFFSYIESCIISWISVANISKFLDPWCNRNLPQRKMKVTSLFARLNVITSFMEPSFMYTYRVQKTPTARVLETFHLLPTWYGKFSEKTEVTPVAWKDQSKLEEQGKELKKRLQQTEGKKLREKKFEIMLLNCYLDQMGLKYETTKIPSQSWLSATLRLQIPCWPPQREWRLFCEFLTCHNS